MRKDRYKRTRIEEEAKVESGICGGGGIRPGRREEGGGGGGGSGGGRGGGWGVEEVEVYDSLLAAIHARFHLKSS